VSFCSTRTTCPLTCAGLRVLPSFLSVFGSALHLEHALAELHVWAYRRPDPTLALESIDKMLFHEVSVVNHDSDAAKVFAESAWKCNGSGRDAPSVDLLIASTALVFDLTLVTHNTSDFQHIPGLRLDDWLTP